MDGRLVALGVVFAVIGGCGPAPGAGSASGSGATGTQTSASVGSDGASTGTVRPDLPPEPPPPPWERMCPAGDYIGSNDALYAECDPYLQNCPEGMKCMPWADDGGNSWNALKCSPVDAKPQELGEPCFVQGNGVSGVDDCVRGAMCWRVDPETGMGTCTALCGGSPEEGCCPDTCSVCGEYNDGALPLCLPTCDPVLQDCDRGTCMLVDETRYVCVLQGGDLGSEGDPCEYSIVCDPGLYCAAAADVPGCTSDIGCCARFCDPADPDACVDLPETACVPLEVQPPRGCTSTVVGGCVKPA